MEYFPLGEELTFEHALIQASQALDLTAMIALEQKNSEQMLAVGETWVKLADFMISASDHEDKKRQDDKSDFPVGFQATAPVDGEPVHIENDEILAEEEDDVRD